MILVVGLTGGIGSGKSTVAELFAGKGIPVIDADAITRELVEPGQPALAEIAQRFGPGMLDDDGRLDRRRLRQEAFATPERRRELEAILHPRVREAVRERVQTLDGTHPYCIVAIPLLVESGMQELVDRILVVDVPVSVQIARTVRRDGVSEEQVRAILEAQAGRDERLAWADDVLDNTSNDGSLREVVDALDARYRALAAQRG
ncbi:MAG TPA: dephospho-CoA kinase [Gammaproteobacteria bacterium]|nr:dephospho-CoA kinase [Gammaproteobacteria bacterium]